MGAPSIKRPLKAQRRELKRLFDRGAVTRVTIVQEQNGLVVAVATNYERAAAALERMGRKDDNLLMEDFEVQP